MATYIQIADLKDNVDFKRRVGVAIIRYAGYMLGNVADQDFREYKVQWARRALVATDEQVYRIMGFVLTDPNVQTDLGLIDDAALQGAVEFAINSNMTALM
jgi:hypothetical protein